MTSTRFTVTVYTRHSSACSRKADPYWRRCRCPKWLYINENGERTQRSARTRSWDGADEQRRSLERQFELLALQGIAGGGITPKPQTTARTQEGPITLATAVAKFLAAKRKENLAESTIPKLTAIFERQLLTRAGSERIDYVESVGVAELQNWSSFAKRGPMLPWRAKRNRNGSS
jgi:integrase/recombinase XerD